jgi:hypothetical protein
MEMVEPFEIFATLSDSYFGHTVMSCVAHCLQNSHTVLAWPATEVTTLINNC